MAMVMVIMEWSNANVRWSMGSDLKKRNTLLLHLTRFLVLNQLKHIWIFWVSYCWCGVVFGLVFFSFWMRAGKAGAPLFSVCVVLYLVFLQRVWCEAFV